ncbi:hypothetical protein ECIG_04726 [Escherichia coli M605]|uniref:Type IV pilus biogenesis protein PilP n=1 Tax=Escherichia coli M605 TaxID=656417 RepID=F4SY86_ECOLX|nr:hypothetical protein [Escherichia coli]EGI16333.1 hypothetical protein ECIG_04726 [Escherichia coli M605]
MRRPTYFLFFIISALFLNNNLQAANQDVNINQVSPHTLPEVTIEGYKKELLEFQRLQRENEKLKLEEKNFSIRQRLQSLFPGDIESTKVVSVFSGIESKGRLSAQIYNSREGMRVVNVGNYIMGHYEVIKITPVSVFLQDIKLSPGSKKIKLPLIAPGAGIVP